MDVSTPITEAIKNEVYDILVADMGANEAVRADYLRHWPECQEFRFMGVLGYGGKIRHSQLGTTMHKVFVDYYAENHKPELDARVEAVNEKLQAILDHAGIRRCSF